MLDLVDNVLDDDFTVAQALAGAGDHAADALGIPPAIATLAEAAAADRIVRSAGHPARDLFDPYIAVSVTRISSLGIEDQQRLVKDAIRHCTPTHRRADPRSPSVGPVPSVKSPQRPQPPPLYRPALAPTHQLPYPTFDSGFPCVFVLARLLSS